MPYDMTYGYLNPNFQNASIKETCSKWNKITLNGKGIIRVKPDVAVINLGVETRGGDLQVAQEENAERSNNLIDTLLSLGIAENDIQTDSYIINPEYEYVEGRQIFKGYRVIHNYNVRIRNIGMLGEIIDAAVKSGANTASNIEFSLSNGSKYYNQALNLAIEDAIRKAENVERRFNYSVNKIPISIKEESLGLPSPFESISLKAASATTPIKSGLIEITASIIAVFCYR